LNYKFWNSATNAPNSGFESGANRVLTLGANGTTNTLPLVYFSNLAGQRFVTFSVNMAIQQGTGSFNPSNQQVEVKGSFNGWTTGNQLTNQGGNIYSGTLPLSSSNTNTAILYKYFTTGTNAVGFESGSDRTFDLVFNENGSNAPALVLTTNYFSDALFYLTGTPLNSFSTTQGTASASQIVTVNGQGLTANIVAAAPVGYEVSTDGSTYGSSANLVPDSGTVTAAPLYTRIAASTTAGSPAGNVVLTSTGSQSVNVAVSGTVAANSFTTWADGAPLNSTNLGIYAIGGATSPTATNGVPSTNVLTSSNLSIIAMVRTNDPTLAVYGQSATNLSTGPWQTNDVTRTNSLDQTGVPANCARQIFSTPRNTDTKKFLRIQSTLPAQ
jgi:hypothetical protein